MKAELFLDCGNTRIKWCFRHDSSQYGVITWSEAFETELENCFASFSQQPQRVWVSSVAGAERNALLEAALLRLSGHDPHFVQVERHFLGLKIAYSELKHLGVDRWLAMLAAFNSAQSAVCVIDAGTAINAEFISASGEQIGGLIAPGKETMRRALHSDTGEVDTAPLSMPPQQWQPQNATRACVEHGISAMIAGFVHQVCCRCVDFGITKMIITGGDAEFLLPHARSQSIPVDFRQYEVLNGLQEYAKFKAGI